MNLWDHLEARAQRREERRALLISRGLDLRSLARLTFETLDPRLFIAFAIIGMFGWAYAENMSDDTMKGALIAAFAGAWGYYLGSSNTASRANDRADRALELSHETIKQLPAPPTPDVELEPGQKATIAATPDDRA